MHAVWTHSVIYIFCRVAVNADDRSVDVDALHGEFYSICTLLLFKLKQTRYAVKPLFSAVPESHPAVLPSVPACTAQRTWGTRDRPHALQASWPSTCSAPWTVPDHRLPLTTASPTRSSVHTSRDAHLVCWFAGSERFSCAVWNYSLLNLAQMLQLQSGIEQVQALTDISHSALCCNINETHAPIANPSNSAQLGGTPYHSPKLHPGPCSSVGMRQGTGRQTDRQTRHTDTETDKHTDGRD